MAKLNLQINVDKAKAGLDRTRQSIVMLDNAIKKFGSSAGKFKTVIADINKLGSLNVSKTVASVTKLAAALNRIRVPKGLGSTVSQLNTLAGAFTRASTAARGFATTMNTIKAPPAVATIGAKLNTVGGAFTRATGQARAFSAALKTIKTPPGLAGLSGKLGNTGAALKSAAGGATKFGGAIKRASGVLAGFGVALGAVGVKRFVAGSFQITNVMQRLRIVLQTVREDQSLVNEEIAFVRKLADSTATSLLALASSYAKFTAAAATSNFTLEQTQKIFSSVTKAARVLQLSSADTSLVFLALEQIISKGIVASEELRRQLGERLPGAVALFAQSMGIGTDELLKLLKAGKVTAQQLEPFAELLEERFAKGLPAAMLTAQAAFQTLANRFLDIQESFGAGFFDKVTPAIQRLAAAFKDPEFLTSVQTIGTAIGTLAAGVIDAFTFATKHIGLFSAALAAISAVAAIAGIQLLFRSFGFLGKVLGLTVIPLIGRFIAATGAIILRGAVAAVIGFTAALASMSIPMLVITIALFAAAAAILVFTGQLDPFVAKIGTILEPLKNAALNALGFGEALDTEKTAAENAAGATGELANKANEADDATNKAEDSVSNFGATVTDVNGVVREVATGIQILGDGFTRSTKPIGAYTVVIGRVGGVTKQMIVPTEMASDKVKDLGENGDNAAGAMDKLAGELDEAKRAADRAAASFKKAADAADKLAKAQKKIGGGGGGDFGAQRRGGLAGNRSQTQFAPAGAFTNAPSFQDGTGSTNGTQASLPGGGIPSILHPNEAVVPLPGGRSIPVSFRGLSAPGSGGGRMDLSAEKLKVLRQIKRAITVNTNQINVQTKILREESNQVEFLIATGNEALFSLVKRMDDIAFEIKQAAASGGGGGGGGGGGFVGTGGSGGVSKDFAAKQVQLLQQQAAALGIHNAGGGQRLGGTSFGDPQGNITSKILRLERTPSGGLNISFFREFSSAQLDAQNNFLDSQIDFAKDFGTESDVLKAIEAKLGFEKELAAFNAKIEAAPSFSGQTGSPNLSKDPTGGFKAVIHPDEAVIPLQDGRTVPVDLSNTGLTDSISDVQERLGELDDRMTQMDDVSGGNAPDSTNFGQLNKNMTAPPVGGGDKNVKINITMNIETPDVESFNKSKSQVLQDMTMEFEKVKKTLGEIPFDEDPTKRPE